MNSAFPFSGGSYGFVRAIIGPFWGYFAGCCESIRSVFYLTASVMVFGEILSSVFHLSRDYEPVFWIIFYLTAFSINYFQKSLFWNVSVILGVICLLLLFLYVFASIPEMNFQRYSSSIDYERDGGSFIQGVLSNFVFVSWMFVGVESLPLANFYVQKVKRNYLL
jgi:amino acid transporter